MINSLAVGQVVTFSVFAVLIGALMALLSGIGSAEAVPAGGADNFSIDMDPSSAPGNTATSIGSIESCARIDENDVLDADEDAVDTLLIDVVVGPLGIPASNPIIAFAFFLLYPASQVAVVAEGQDFLLASGPNSAVFSASEGFPDSDGQFESAAADTNTGAPGNIPETGPGVLSRIGLETVASASSGVHDLLLGGSSSHVDPSNDAFPPDNAIDTDGNGFADTVAQVARLAVNQACPEGPAPTLPNPAYEKKSPADGPVSSAQTFH